MKIIVAIDSFKGSITSEEATEAVCKGISSKHPQYIVEAIPIADGGEGTLSIILNHIQGKIIHIKANNPCMEMIDTQYAISQDGTTAYIEMANISGLTLLQESQRNPMKATSYGTGELIEDALNKGCKNIILSIGGSATNDGGTGMLQALGIRFLDKNGTILGQGGEILEKISYIDRNSQHPQIKHARFTVICDVQNPFFGPNGAAHIFARQKGADDKMIYTLDQGMQLFSQVIQQTTGIDLSDIPGSGAAGGIGGAAFAFLSAQLNSGAKTMIDLCQVKEKSAHADFIITGEGKMDKQTLMGKVPGEILKMAQSMNIPVIGIAGRIEDKEELLKAGFHSIHEISPRHIPLSESMKPHIAQGNIIQAIQSIM